MRLSELARECGAWPVKLLSRREKISPKKAGKVVESVWGAPLYLSYGQTESFGTLGASARAKTGYHGTISSFFRDA